MSKAEKQGYWSDEELPEVFRLPDGRLIWFVVPGSFDDIRVLQGDSWVPLEDATVRAVLDADGVSKEEIRAMVSAGKFKAAK
jgi:hypothetical protein